MGYKLVDHETLGKVFYDGERGTYLEYTKPKHKYFTRGGKSAPYFENYMDFIESNKKIAVVAVVCIDTGRTRSKKRYCCDLLDHNNHSLRFFNIEPAAGRWVENKIANCIKNKCYFLLLSKHKDATNDCFIISTIRIEKGMQ